MECYIFNVTLLPRLSYNNSHLLGSGFRFGFGFCIWIETLQYPPNQDSYRTLSHKQWSTKRDCQRWRHILHHFVPLIIISIVYKQQRIFQSLYVSQIETRHLELCKTLLKWHSCIVVELSFKSEKKIENEIEEFFTERIAYIKELEGGFPMVISTVIVGRITFLSFTYFNTSPFRIFAAF